MTKQIRPSRYCVSAGIFSIDAETSSMSFNKLRKLVLQDLHDMLNNKNPLYDGEVDEADEPENISGKVKEREPSDVKKKVKVEFMKSYA